MEVWKDIIGYEGRYQVSNKGQVRSLDMKVWNGKTYYDKKGRILKQMSDHQGQGYLYINLPGKPATKVHRLVAIHFVDCRTEDLEVNHIDGNAKNNNADNLEWITHRENCIHWVKINGVHSANYKKRKIIAVEIEKKFDSVSDAVRWLVKQGKTKASTSTVSRAYIQTHRTAYGYHWNYIEE